MAGGSIISGPGMVGRSRKVGKCKQGNQVSYEAIIRPAWLHDSTPYTVKFSSNGAKVSENAAFWRAMAPRSACFRYAQKKSDGSFEPSEQPAKPGGGSWARCFVFVVVF
jgi:hypothetical protein